MFKLAIAAATAALTITAVPANAQTYSFQTKQPVFAQWSDGKWYPGYIESQTGDSYTVKFWDGDVATVPRDRIGRDTLRRGDELFVRKQNGNRRAVVTERHAFALIVTYSDGSKEAVPMAAVVVDNYAENRGTSDSAYDPAVLANICNNTSHTVYVALAMDTYNGGAGGHASTGWSTIAAGECNIRNLTQFWRNQTRYPAGQRFLAPTYIYGQTEDAFQTSIAGGAITFGRGLRWGGEDGENEYCVMDRPTISFRHVVDPSIELFESAYCKDAMSFKVSFDKLQLPSEAQNLGGVVNWTFGE